MISVAHVQKVSGISGSEAHLLSLLPGLRARGWDARMIMLHEDEPGAREFADRLQADGVPVTAHRLHLDLDPLAFARLLRTHATIVHTHLVHADLLALPAAALSRVPARISTKHGFNEFRANRLLAAADRTVGRLAHRQIAISAGLADYLARTEGFDRSAFTVVHYGIDAGPPPPPPPPEPRLLAVGRLIPIKGFDILLEAFARAREQLPSLTLEIAGDGPLADPLRAAAPEGVSFLGRVPSVTPLYERNAVVVVPSRGEGFGMVALEAAERGRAADRLAGRRPARDRRRRRDRDRRPARGRRRARGRDRRARRRSEAGRAAGRRRAGTRNGALRPGCVDHGRRARLPRGARR